jgi:cytoskeletal protein CcmA (bactofilin family)
MLPSIFGNKKKKNIRPEAALSIIAAGTEIEGNMYCDGDLRIEGHVHGTVVCKSRLIVGPSGRIDGDVDAYQIVVAGNIAGDVTARDGIQLLETGVIRGDVVTEHMAMLSGALLNGKLTMGIEATDYIRQHPSPSLDSIRQIPSGVVSPLQIETFPEKSVVENTTINNEPATVNNGLPPTDTKVVSISETIFGEIKLPIEPPVILGTTDLNVKAVDNSNKVETFVPDNIPAALETEEASVAENKTETVVAEPPVIEKPAATEKPVIKEPEALNELPDRADKTKVSPPSTAKSEIVGRPKQSALSAFNSLTRKSLDKPTNS